uniref:Uncharacterized protein n=1 Tax=Terrapene triunguis TaxID=2587831 RepID=A0A674KE34_9SAUR
PPAGARPGHPNLCVVLHGPGDVCLPAQPLTGDPTSQVLLHVHSVGLWCGAQGSWLGEGHGLGHVQAEAWLSRGCSPLCQAGCYNPSPPSPAACCCVGLAPSGSSTHGSTRCWSVICPASSCRRLRVWGRMPGGAGALGSGSGVQAGAYTTGWQHLALVGLGLRSLAQMPCWMPPCRRRLSEGVRVPQHVAISHRPAVRPLVTHQFPLEETLQCAPIGNPPPTACC